MHNLFASIDLGTNTLRLLIAEYSGTHLIPKTVKVTMPRIGKNFSHTSYVSDDTIEKVISILKDFRKEIKKYNIKNVFPVATESLRKPTNSSYILQEIYESTGFNFKILTGAEESELSFLGATSALPAEYKNQKFLVIDIGGGSTEFSYGYPDKPLEFTASLKMGSVRLSEYFNLSNNPSKKNLMDAENYILNLLKTLPSFDSKIIGVAGTITTIKSISIKLDSYDKNIIQNSILTIEEINSVYDLLIRLTIAEKMNLKGLESGRADVIFGGTLITKTILNYLNKSKLIVSDEDILYGVIEKNIKQYIQ